MKYSWIEKKRIKNFPNPHFVFVRKFHLWVFVITNKHLFIDVSWANNLERFNWLRFQFLFQFYLRYCDMKIKIWWVFVSLNKKLTNILLNHCTDIGGFNDISLWIWNFVVFFSLHASNFIKYIHNRYFDLSIWFVVFLFYICKLCRLSNNWSNYWAEAKRTQNCNLTGC